MELLWLMNPWWEYKDWEKRDKHLIEYNSMRIRWFPKWLNDISLTPKSVNFVIGPRQVGKTTGLKILIKNLLSKVEESFQVIYLDLELFSNLAEFREALIYYFNLKEKEGIEKSYVLLDEVSSLNEWYRIVKGFIDVGKMEKDAIIATGSSSINILKHAESFAGRRGEGRDVYTLPLSFPDFAEVKGVNVHREERLADAFNDYLLQGGFPKSINGISTEDEFIKTFERELSRFGRSVENAKAIISTLLSMVPSALSYHSIAQKIGLSHKTVENYIEIFQDLFISKVIYFKSKDVVFRKEKKIIFRDPFISKSFAIWCGKDLRKDFLYESIVQEHLFRKFGEIYYYRDSYEIDCISGNLRIEVKAGKPHRRYPRNVTVLEESDVPKFLIDLFCHSFKS